MIDLILNRAKRNIVLDRLLYKDPVHGSFLITDPQTIQQHAINHFQQYALPQAAPPQMNDRWLNQFAFKSYINDNWYQNIMVPPTWEEWIGILQSLPNDKACGLSNLHNEFYKQTGISSKKLTWELAKMCFKLGYILDDWKQAYLYLILKPMDWQSDLTNTRPLTLLDTMRKAVMKLLTNRLSRIMAKHNILKGNNFAGLPGGSTEIPIKLMNMIIEYAKENNKPV